MGWKDVRARLEAIITGDYGTDYAIPAGHFHLAPGDRTIDRTDLGSAERAVKVVIRQDRTPHLPINRMSGHGIYTYPVDVQVCYVRTQAGEDWDGASGEQSGAGTDEGITDRANADRNRLEAALGSWLNTGGLTPHIIDLRPTGGGGIETLGQRAILTVPFELLVRVPLTTTGE
jgi:hypothetical protein